MIKAILTVLINLMGTVVQVVTLPLNAIITATLPDLSDKITEATNNIPNIFSGMSWPLSFIPPYILTVLIFIVTCEIAKHTIKVSSHAIIKVWHVFQKIKFW